jgi:hypothetical protein
MGWRPLRAVSRGERSLTLGLPGEAVPEDDELAVALRARLDPQPARIDAETSRELLAALDLEALPLDPGGRDFGPAEDWRRATQAVWLARGLYSEQKLQGGSLLLTRVDRQIDPDNLASRLDRGQLMALRRQKRAQALLGEALSRDPRNPDVLHWYAHAIWGEDLEQAERILETILPALPNDGDVLYDLACARSLAGDPERSQSFLRSSIEAGFRNWDLIENDPDLRNLRESGLFSEVLQEYR